jgi:hypothetical protein
MGAWGPGPFDNDDAGDWTYRLTPAADERVVAAALAAALGGAAPNAATAQSAVAAAEVVAAGIGRPHATIPAEVEAWVAARPGPQWGELAPLAARAVQRVLAGSELRELWDESGDESDWSAELEGLVARLVS